MQILISTAEELHQHVMWDRGNYEAVFKVKPTKIAISRSIRILITNELITNPLMCTQDINTRKIRIQGLEVVKEPLMGDGRILISH